MASIFDELFGERDAMKKPASKPAAKPAVKKTSCTKPKTDAEARALAIRNGWGPLLKRFPEMGKA